VLRQEASHLLLKCTNLGYETVLTAACAGKGCSVSGFFFVFFYSCEVVAQKLREALENINEVMTRLKQQIDSKHLHLLYLVDIKQYVQKNRSPQFRQTTHDYFCKEA
jgi:hypothetical protein